MPKIRNKVTGKEQTVTPEQLKAIQENKITAPLYDVTRIKEPAEVTEMKAKNTASETK